MSATSISTKQESPDSTDSPGHPTLVAAVRWGLILAALGLGGSLKFGGPRAQLGMCAGAVLSLLNLQALRYLAARFGGQYSVGTILLAMQVKLALLGLCIFLAMRLLPLSTVALTVGLSIMPVAILLAGLLTSRNSDPVDAPPGPPGRAQEN